LARTMDITIYTVMENQRLNLHLMEIIRCPVRMMDMKEEWELAITSMDIKGEEATKDATSIANLDIPESRLK